MIWSLFSIFLIIILFFKYQKNQYQQQHLIKFEELLGHY